MTRPNLTLGDAQICPPNEQNKAKFASDPSIPPFGLLISENPLLIWFPWPGAQPTLGTEFGKSFVAATKPGYCLLRFT